MFNPIQPSAAALRSAQTHLDPMLLVPALEMGSDQTVGRGRADEGLIVACSVTATRSQIMNRLEEVGLAVAVATDKHMSTGT